MLTAIAGIEELKAELRKTKGQLSLALAVLISLGFDPADFVS